MTITAAQIASWCDEEYRRLAARPYRGDSADEHQCAGAKAMLAEIAAMCRAGKLARHGACREQWLLDQAQRAREDDVGCLFVEGCLFIEDNDVRPNTLIPIRIGGKR